MGVFSSEELRCFTQYAFDGCEAFVERAILTTERLAKEPEKLMFLEEDCFQEISLVSQFD